MRVTLILDCALRTPTSHQRAHSRERQIETLCAKRELLASHRTGDDLRAHDEFLADPTTSVAHSSARDSSLG
jgi:hypothetical protein